MDARERYHRDPLFSHVVDRMVAMLSAADLTPADLAHAAVLAATFYAEQHQAPIQIVIVPEDEKLGPVSRRILDDIMARFNLGADT